METKPVGTLYLVGTPIGNLEDFSPRALRILSEVDFIAAEDTRVTLKLLTHFDLKKPLVSYFSHNRRERGDQIIERLLNGENAAIVTDAGMPCISDPGEDLVALCAEHQIPVQVVPGPSAVISALAISGLSVSRFSFEGFLSVNKRSRQEHLASLVDDPRTLVFYEAPHKLLATLNDLYEAFGDRKISIAREMTKIHEEVLRFSLKEAIEYFTLTPPRGEFVLIIEGAAQKQAPELTLEEAVERVAALQQDGLSLSDACKQVAASSPFKKSELYKAALESR